MSKSVCNVGFVGLGDFKKKTDREAYSVWKNMIHRCYSDKYQKNKPTYSSCSVCDEWLNFQNFAKWFYENYPCDKGCYHLDKDLRIAGNKEYSPKACLFVPAVVNTFISDSAAIRGSCLIGVYHDLKNKRFTSKCNNPITRKVEHLGSFNNELDAHISWRKRKSEIALELALMQESEKIKNAIISWKNGLDNCAIHPYRPNQSAQ